LAVAFILGAGLSSARAQALPDSQNGRYVFSQSTDGVVRLDTRSGQVSTCTKQGTGWACYAVPDERVALEAEIGRLQAENGRLKNELLGRGQSLPGAARGESTGKSSDGKPADGKAAEPKSTEGKMPDLKLPDDAELNRALAFMEKVWRRLIEMVMRAQQDMAGSKTLAPHRE
jgi:hypothetical protein